MIRDALRAEGDRVRFGLPSTGHRVSAGALGTIERLEDSGGMSVGLDGGRAVGLGADEPRHLDCGYAVGGFAPKDLAAGRLIAHFEGGEPDAVVNRRKLSVAQEQFRGGARVYTDDAEGLGATLMRNVESQFAGDHSVAALRPGAQSASAELSIGTQLEGAEQALAKGLEPGLVL